jgi:hypothetical protein
LSKKKHQLTACLLVLNQACQPAWKSCELKENMLRDVLRGAFSPDTICKAGFHAA